jgi:hypothetical protein
LPADESARRAVLFRVWRDAIRTLEGI